LDGKLSHLRAYTYTEQHTKTRTYMPLVRFEPTIPEFVRSKIIRVSDRAATGTGGCIMFLVYLIGSYALQFTSVPRII